MALIVKYSSDLDLCKILKLFALSLFNHGQAKLLKYNDYFPKHVEGGMILQI